MDAKKLREVSEKLQRSHEKVEMIQPRWCLLASWNTSYFWLLLLLLLLPAFRSVKPCARSNESSFKEKGHMFHVLSIWNVHFRAFYANFELSDQKIKRLEHKSAPTSISWIRSIMHCQGIPSVSLSAYTISKYLTSLVFLFPALQKNNGVSGDGRNRDL